MTHRKHRLSTSACLLVLLLGLPAGLARTEQLDGGPHAAEPDGLSSRSATTLPYSGHLETAGAPADGLYDFDFELYDAREGGTLLGAVTRLDVPVRDGSFLVQLDFGVYLDGTEERWLQVSAREAGAGSFTALAPRRDVRSLRGACQVTGSLLVDDGIVVQTPTAIGLLIDGGLTHGVQVLAQGDGLRASANGHAVVVEAAGSNGLHVTSADDNAIEIESAGGNGVQIDNATSDGIQINSAGRDGIRVGNVGGVAGNFGGDVLVNGSVQIESSSGDGVVASAGNHGVLVESAGGNGVQVNDPAFDGVYVLHAGRHGVQVAAADYDGVSVESAGRNGVQVNDSAFDGVYVLHAGRHGVQVAAADNDGVVAEATGIGMRVQNSGGSGFVVQATGANGVQVNNATFDGIQIQSAGRDGIRVGTVGGLAGNFGGDVFISGNLSKGSGSFLIDHPLDPTHRLLAHSFVESPDMMNVYNGNVVLGDEGAAWVELPDYFQALNRDVRYQLTPIGAFAPLFVAQKVQDNRFRIAGGEPGMEVSWQITGVRKDPYAEVNRIEVERDKPRDELGTYLHPEAYETVLAGSTAKGEEPAR